MLMQYENAKGDMVFIRPIERVTMERGPDRVIRSVTGYLRDVAYTVPLEQSSVIVYGEGQVIVDLSKRG